MTPSLLPQSKSGYPLGVTLIALSQMWESFSFFGMRALLVLYLISQAGFSSTDAFVLYTLYICFVKIFAAGGGYVVDRLLGQTRGVVLGGTLIAMGHLLLTFSSQSFLFYVSLGTIVCGSALFRVSLQSLLGFCYDKQDRSRDRGFTLFYVGMNLGGLLAALLCGFVAKIYGWHAGFGLAAFGILIGIGIFLSKIRVFSAVEKSKKRFPLAVFFGSLMASLLIAVLLSHFQTVRLLALPLGAVAFVSILFKVRTKINKTVLVPVVGCLFLFVAFSTAEELWGSLLMVFAENHIQRTLLGFEIPSAALAATNPLTIIVLGPLLAKRNISSGLKMALAFLFLGAAFFVLAIASWIEGASLLYLVVGLMSIAIGELLLNPTVYSFVSQSTPQESSGSMMGAATVALSMGSLLSGEVANFPFEPGMTFILVGVSALALFILLLYFALKKGSKVELE